MTLNDTTASNSSESQPGASRTASTGSIGSPGSNQDDEGTPVKADDDVQRIVKEVLQKERVAQLEAELGELKQDIAAVRPLIIELSRGHRNFNMAKAWFAGSDGIVDSVEEELWGIAEKIFPGIRDWE